MTEVRMKNLSRMHIHPDRMGAIRDSEVKQLYLLFYYLEKLFSFLGNEDLKQFPIVLKKTLKEVS